jgi:hypothetical protein
LGTHEGGGGQDQWVVRPGITDQLPREEGRLSHTSDHLDSNLRQTVSHQSPQIPRVLALENGSEKLRADLLKAGLHPASDPGGWLLGVLEIILQIPPQALLIPRGHGEGELGEDSPPRAVSL